MFIKTGQRRDIRANVAMFPRVKISNIAMLGSNVATFPRVAQI